MRKIYILISLIVIIVAGAFWFAVGPKNFNQPICTADLEICPDGSVVGHVGPNCEYAECPKVSTPKPAAREVILQIGEKGKVGDLSITVNKFVSDSRCPLDVQCVWAGEFKANITLTDPTRNETIDISTANAPHVFGDKKISLVNVVPVRQSGQEIKADQYRITLLVNNK